MKKIIIILLFSFLMINPVYAYSEESVTTHAHYEHPETGIIEDAGNNKGIGQGMCENVLYEKALVEEIDNKLYACVRYNLANNIKDVSFAVQNRGDSNFIVKNYQIVTESGDTRDYRFEIPSKDAIVRSSFFVEAMGRNVIFYFDFSDYVAGNTDFIALGENGKMQNLTNSNVNGSDGDIIETEAVNNLIEAGDLGYEHGLLMKDSPEIKAIYGDMASENLNSDSREEEITNEKPNGEWGFISKTMFQSLMLLIILLVFALIITAILLYFISNHIKNINSIREAELYEED